MKGRDERDTTNYSRASSGLRRRFGDISARSGDVSLYTVVAQKHKTIHNMNDIP